MADDDEEDVTAEDAAGHLAKVRGRPCMVIASHVCRDLSDAIDDLIGQIDGDALDVVIHSPGGDLNAAYLIVRSIRRRFKETAAFVPSWAKSAATLIFLGMGDLVLAESGELGPLDAQLEEGKSGDFRRVRSCLERFKGLEQLQSHSVETFNMLVQICLQQKLQVSDACKVATDFTAAVVGPMHASVDPDALGESARYLAVGEEYAHRVLRRYRPDIYNRQLVRRLVWNYPDHGFVIDREELMELGIPVRPPSEEESLPLELLTIMLKQLDDDDDEALFVVGSGSTASDDAASGESTGADDSEGEEIVKPPIHKVK